MFVVVLTLSCLFGFRVGVICLSVIMCLLFLLLVFVLIALFVGFDVWYLFFFFLVCFQCFFPGMCVLFVGLFVCVFV